MRGLVLRRPAPRARRGRGEGEGERAELLRSALEAHQSALAFDPSTWKWEWAFARLHFADLAARAGLAPRPSFVIDGAEIRIEGIPFELEHARWHAVRDERSRESLGRQPVPGDLLLAIVRGAGGERELVRLVVGAE